MPETVHIVDPKPDERSRLATVLASESLCVHTYDAADQFLAQACPTSSGCVIASADLPGAGVHALIAEIRKRGLPLAVIVIGGAPDLAIAVEFMRAGAADFLEQPVSDRRLRSSVRQAVGIDP